MLFFYALQRINYSRRSGKVEWKKKKKKTTIASIFVYNELSSSAHLAPNDVANLPTFKINLIVSFTLSFSCVHPTVSLEFSTSLYFDFDSRKELQYSREKR